MKKKILAFIGNPAAIAASFTMIVGSVARAASGFGPAPTLVTSTGNLDKDLFCPIIDVMFWVLLSVSIIMVLWAAYLYVTSEGEAEKPSQARKMILYAMIGIAIALIAKGVPSIVADVFGYGAGGGGTGFGLSC